MNLKFQIEQEVGKENYFVVLSLEFQSFEDRMREEMKNEMLQTLMHMFEVETLLTAVITDKKQFTEIRINTKDTPMIKKLQQKLEEVWGKDPKMDIQRNVPVFRMDEINFN